MVTFNLLNIALLLVGYASINGVMPEDFREGMGRTITIFFMVIWTIIWFITFVLFDHQIIIT